MPAVRVAKAVGTQPILDVIHQLGVTTVMTNDLSLALGSPAVSLLDMETISLVWSLHPRVAGEGGLDDGVTSNPLMRTGR